MTFRERGLKKTFLWVVWPFLVGTLVPWGVWSFFPDFQKIPHSRMVFMVGFLGLFVSLGLFYAVEREFLPDPRYPDVPILAVGGALFFGSMSTVVLGKFFIWHGASFGIVLGLFLQLHQLFNPPSSE